jgi:hypothetical protein
MSSPSTPKNQPNSHPVNNFHPKNSWHSSYAPLDTINIWIEFIEPREPARIDPLARAPRFVNTRKRFITDILAVK